MIGYVVNELGSAELQDIPKPIPASNEVLIKMEACALNFADLLLIKGTYQEKPALPFCPGMEIAGRVVDIGADVSGFSIGDRVAGVAGHGGLAEYAVLEAAATVALPDAVGFAEAAAFQVAYGTSHLALSHRANIKAGETLLVFGAAGGVGLAAVELGKLMGARVIASARGEDKLAIAKASGADHVIDSDAPDIREQIKALGGADVVYDPVGGAAFDTAMRVTNPDGRILAIGFASGTVPQIPANILLVKNITVIGLYWGGYRKFAPKVLSDSLKTLLDWQVEGRLTPHISHQLPLSEAANALSLLKTRKSTGKVVVVA
ncbi:NADPH:quinone oxidoreductase family protein [Halocynthiibacter sp. C4]|uniref:NADPH:quinone oxidoreductase family protein n=1 Tax=Halocynthiibacter sp. C4 TaxID=2992758 RepID=UPI00237A8F6F|nr:NADPH:quinone oxidoreductase family protein [Halocynthiibacter sp. C4]MDE0590222.1 NADPH:quinone oxidoreductase family protein [Halocynthiibacter sp. C4]